MKRVFVDPQLLTKSWFQDLGTSEKMAFITILLLCDDVGVWHVNTKLVEFLVGSTVDWKRLEKCNGNLVPLREGVIWVPDYCRFQYKHIEANNNANESYRKLAESHGLLGDIRATYRGSTLRLLLPNPSPTLDQGLTKGTSRVKDKEEDKDKDSSFSLQEEREDNSGDLGEGPSPSKASSLGKGWGKMVVERLNERAGTSFKADTDQTVKFLKARAAEGFVLEDFYAVVDFKCEQWGKKPEMMQYLRPSTLFSPKFESYLQASRNAGVEAENARQKREDERVASEVECDYCHLHGGKHAVGCERPR